MTELTLNLDGQTTTIQIRTAIVAGWTGRDAAAVEEHIAELEALGVTRPSSTPIFYRVSATRLTTDEKIESTPSASGEAEAVLLAHGGRLWVGAGSDHTDRELEGYSVAASKQLVDKPISCEFWAYDDVAPHWDSLVLRSWIQADGNETVYQEGDLKALLPAQDLLTRADPELKDGTVMFCGTLPAIGGVRPAEAFTYELEDPVRGRKITGRYSMRNLPLVT